MLILQPKGKKYRVAMPFNYRDIIVPEGYETDGISYKFRLVGIFINRFDPRYIKAVVVHDYLTDRNDWNKANKYFEELLPDTKIARVMIMAVKMYGRLKRHTMR